MNPPDPPPPGPYDVVVAGAGAAGLWAAGTAAARGRRVLLLEKNRRVGVKILASGGGACNLTTTLSARDAARWFGPRAERFLAPSFRALSPQDLVAEFAALGVPTHVEADLEKVWPDSRKARDVVEALVRRATDAGAQVATSQAVLDLRREDGAWSVRTPSGEVRAEHAVVTVGGKSYPRTGTTGDGYPWMTALGHRVTPLAPALVPLRVEAPWVRALSGISAWVRVEVVDATGGRLLERRRPILFTHFGLSGPAAMDASRFFALAAPWSSPRLCVDWLPDPSLDDVRLALDRAIAAGPSEPLERCVPLHLPERLRRAIVATTGADPSARAGETSKARRHAIVQALKRMDVPVDGTLDWDHAEVTTGGVDLDEVDPGTMESRIAPGLFVAGEILDLDGPIGGFNFQSAFATGEIAGRNA